MSVDKIDCFAQEKKKVLDYLKIIPGIYFLSPQEIEDYQAFVDMECSGKIIITPHLQGYGVYYTSNIREVYVALTEKPEYQQFQLAISKSFLSRFSSEAHAVVNIKSRSFVYLTQEMQDEIVKKTVDLYIESLKTKEIINIENKSQNINIASFAEFLKSFNLDKLILQSLTDLKTQISEKFFNDNISTLDSICCGHIPASSVIPEEQRTIIIKNICPDFIKWSIENNQEPNVRNFYVWVINFHWAVKSPTVSLENLKEQIYQSMISQAAKEFISFAIIKHSPFFMFLSKEDIDVFAEKLLGFFINYSIENKKHISEDDFKNFIKSTLNSVDNINPKKNITTFLSIANKTQQEILNRQKNIKLDEKLRDSLQYLIHSYIQWSMENNQEPNVYGFCTWIRNFYLVFKDSTESVKKNLEFFENLKKRVSEAVDLCPLSSVSDPIDLSDIRYLLHKVCFSFNLDIFVNEEEIKDFTEILLVFFINDVVKKTNQIDDLDVVLENFLKSSLDRFESAKHKTIIHNVKTVLENFFDTLVAKSQTPKSSSLSVVNETQQDIKLDEGLINLSQYWIDFARFNSLKPLGELFKYCFLIPPTKNQLEDLVSVFAADVCFLQLEYLVSLFATLDKKDNYLSLYFENSYINNYFDNIHKKGQIIIENGYDLSIEKVQDDWLYAAATWLLGNKKVQQFGASQAILSKMGFLHNAPSSLVTEAGNVVLIADNAEMAGNVRKLFHSICLPLKPLAKEWFVLLPSERNWLMIGLRLLIPILIASVVIASGFLLISLIVSMPAVFELLMIIPLAYFGFFTASMCIVARDYVYEKIMNYLYADEYSRPKYEVNDALINVFGDTLAKKIRDYYISELKECDILAAEIERKIENKIPATDEEKDYLIINSGPRKAELLDEWSKLTMSRAVEPASKQQLQNLIKRRVKIDSITQYDANKKERRDYIYGYLKAFSDTSNRNGFFQDASLDDTTLSKKIRDKYNKIQSLNEINSGLERTLDIV